MPEVITLERYLLKLMALSREAQDLVGEFISTQHEAQHEVLQDLARTLLACQATSTAARVIVLVEQQRLEELKHDHEVIAATLRLP